MRRLFALGVALLLSASQLVAQAVIDPELQGVYSGMAEGGTAEVIVTFHGKSAPAAADLDALRVVGITSGFTFQALPMAAVLATEAQVQALAASPRVLSVFHNKELQYFNHDARQLTGVDRLRSNADLTRLNRGLPVSGRGVGVYIADSGIDAAHPDLKLGKNVVQNVWAPVNRTHGNTISNLTGFQNFIPLIAIEDQINSDHGGSGHGTHVAGTAAGTGQASAGKHAGMAPGANIIGYGSGATILVLNAIGSFDYMLINQGRYGIRVMNNSWGSSGQFAPTHPINVASRIAAEDRNIVVIFSAGNAGSGLDTHNPYARAPWVISAAASQKDSRLAQFSSRGTRRTLTWQTTKDGQPHTYSWPDEPTVAATGVNLISARAVANALETGTDPYYATMSGTSMAAPVVSGIVALVLEANPLLTPAEVKQILRETATKMPGYESYAAGAGFINAFAAVQKAFALATPFGATHSVPRYVDRIRDASIHNEIFNYSPLSLPGTYKRNVVVHPGSAMVEFKIEFNGVQVPLWGNSGNPLLLDVRDPNGVRYTGFDLYFALYGTRRLSVVVGNPIPGTWTVEVKALTPRGNEAGNFAALPDRVHLTGTQTFLDAPALADVGASHPAKGAIDFALTNGFLGLCGSNTFCPGQSLSRAQLARAFTQFGAIRQFLPLNGGSTFGDVSAADRPFVEAVAARGAALRDPLFQFPGVMSGSGTAFNPGGTINRAQMAEMLVRGVGGVNPAQSHTGDVTVLYNDTHYVIQDQDQIPEALRGYVHVAINSNMLNVYWQIEQGPYDATPTLKAYFRPTSTMTRADAAVAISRYFAQFFK